MAELIGGSGYGDVQATEPSNPSIGDTWLDTSDGNATGKIYADLGNGADWQILPVQNELQEGRTRELLLLLQDKPVPEVQDPLNIQSGLSEGVVNAGDYRLTNGALANFETGNFEATDSEWEVNDGSINSSNPLAGSFSANVGAEFQLRTKDNNPRTITELSLLYQQNTSSTRHRIDIAGGSGSSVAFTYFTDSGDVELNDTIVGQYSADVIYKVRYYNIDYSNEVFDYQLINAGTDTVVIDENSVSFQSSESGIEFISVGSAFSPNAIVDNFVLPNEAQNSGYVTDRFVSPTTEPADFKQWNAIRAEDVTTGGSTSTNPVEFEILDSTDTALNTTRIPKSRIADEPFTMRDRVYSEDAGSDGQSDYQIATTGDGGHFGIPILTVVSVKQNGSVLDSANWSFDPDTDTITIDTSNVTIASGDTIDIKYDFDVFDSTLQPRAYLNRGSDSETSPSISHFRYEYVI